MSKNQFSQKRKRLKMAAHRLHYLLQQSGEGVKEQVQNLLKAINKLIKELQYFISRSEMKKILGATALFFGFSFISQAQEFKAPVQNPFGLQSLGEYATFPTFADLDDDGDFDIISSDFYGIKFTENTGTAKNPQFTTPVSLPIMTTYIANPTMVDIDDDGDLDFMSLSYDESTGVSLTYYENIGTPKVYSFSSVQLNPFGISGVDDNVNFLTAADIDGDGDFDLLMGEYYGTFRYYENTGTKNAPVFGTYVTNPFGLSQVSDFPNLVFADLDGDGDLDLIIGDYSGNFNYLKNTGTKTSPSFAQNQVNPFGLSQVNHYAAAAVADLDDDGDLDILAGEYYGNLQYFENDPKSGITERTVSFSLIVYPNPVVDFLHIKADEALEKVDVFDVSGKLVKSTNLEAQQIDLKELPSGVYTVQVHAVNGAISSQVINKK